MPAVFITGPKELNDTLDSVNNSNVPTFWTRVTVILFTSTLSFFSFSMKWEGAGREGKNVDFGRWLVAVLWIRILGTARITLSHAQSLVSHRNLLNCYAEKGSGLLSTQDLYNHVVVLFIPALSGKPRDIIWSLTATCFIFVTVL